MTVEELIFRMQNYLEIYNHRPKGVKVNISITPDTLREIINVLSDQRHKIKELESNLNVVKQKEN